MTIEPPAPGEPRRPHGPRDPGDAWVVAPTGEKYWGRFGAAGLLALDPERGVLLQHRVSWSHFGNNWALPGGARHEGESARDGALRESGEEAGVPASAVRARFESVLDLGIWSYSTLVADVTPFEPVISDPESVALSGSLSTRSIPSRCTPDSRPRGPPCGRLTVRPAIVVDVANVMGSVPDGWWKDRAGAATRLVTRSRRCGTGGVDADLLGCPRRDGSRRSRRCWKVRRGAAEPAALRSTCVAPRVRATTRSSPRARAGGGVRPIVVVTSDRGLAARVEELGATVHGARWLLEQLG